MTVAAIQYPVIGVQALTNSSALGVEVATAVSGYVPLIPVGTIATFNDPFFGGLECIRLSIAGGSTVQVGSLSTIAPGFAYTALPNTANQGVSVAAATVNVPNNASFTQYAWFAIAGRYPVFATASVAAGTAFGITAAGQVGAISAGKQILNAAIVNAATTTVVKGNTVTQSGSPLLKVSNADGWFVGVALSGAGIPASTSVGAIDPTGTVVSMVQTGTTTAQNATASGAVSVTGTYNDGTKFWNVASFDRPFAQGQIT
ncbi:MAG: hypothetical protein HY255_08945 [Betaproteobacteria bacterium]|nr:hypothetical protein [Betaproteobacteria bacterium]